MLGRRQVKDEDDIKILDKIDNKDIFVLEKSKDKEVEIKPLTTPIR